MEMVLSTHSSAEAFASDLHQCIIIGDERCIDSFLDNSVKLLDTCVVLKASIADIKSYCSYLKAASRAVEKESIGEIQLKRSLNSLKKCMDALKRGNDVNNHLTQRRSKLENCSSMLRRMGERLNNEDASNGSFFMAIYAAQVITIFVCGLLSSALSFKLKRAPSSIRGNGHSPWSFSLISLQHRMKEQIEKSNSRDSKALLEELDMVDMAVRDFQNILQKTLHGNSSCEKQIQILKVKESAKVLQTLLVDLQQGVHTLEFHVDNIYRNLLRSRIAFLDMYRHSS
ncbi:hypothetical protein KP509_22G029200 [Ceratopteris richardii]|nr:hypothetical protein KP509_22G029200 [Ceratopteris richardii]